MPNVTLQTLSVQIQQVDKKIDNKVDGLDKKFDKIDKGANILERKVDKLNKRMGILEEKLDTHKKILDDHTSRIWHVEQTVEEIKDHTKFIPKLYDNVDKLIGEIQENRQERAFMNHRLQRIEKHLNLEYEKENEN